MCWLAVALTPLSGQLVRVETTAKTPHAMQEYDSRNGMWRGRNTFLRLFAATVWVPRCHYCTVGLPPFGPFGVSRS